MDYPVHSVIPSSVKYLLTLAICLNMLYISGQENAVIRGIITEHSVNKPLTGANILIDSLKGVISGPDGSYSISSSPGTVTLTVLYMGYKPEIRKLQLEAGDTLTVNIELQTELTPLDEIIVTAGRYEQKISDVIVSMEILKPELLTGTNTTSMDYIINRVPGIDVLDGQARIRGGSGYSYGAGSRVLVMVDDLSILSADAGDVKWDYLPVENISQIEIIKGASSVLYGSSALNGVINIRSAYPADKPSTRITLFNGLYMNPQRKELIWWEQQPLFSGASVFHSQKAGNFDIVAGSHLFSDAGYRENEWEQRARLNLNVRYRDKNIPGLSYGLNSNAMYLEKIDFFLWQNADSGAYRQNSQALSGLQGTRINIDPYFTYYHKSGSNHSLKTRIFHVNNTFKNDPGKNNNSTLYHAEYKYHKPFNEFIRGTFGVSSSYSSIVAELYGNHTGFNSAVYAQFDARVLVKMNYSLGVRWETQVLDNLHEIPKPIFRTGMNYQLAPFTFLRTSFGQGYRFPSVAEKYTATSLSSLNIFPNPGLLSEKGWSAELGMKQGLKISQWNGFLDLAYFWTEYRDMIEYVFGIYAPDTVTFPTFDHIGFKSTNVENTRINGIDFTITGYGKLFGIPVKILSGYTYMNPVDPNYDDSDTTDTGNSEMLKYRYRHSAKTDLEVSYRKFSAGIGFVYHSHMKHVDEIFVDPVIGNLILPGYGEYREKHNHGYIVFDSRISYQITHHSTIALIVKNLFNEEYIGRPGDIAPPRNITLQYRIDF